MGFYKNYRDMRSDVRRYNAAVRRANNLAAFDFLPCIFW